jgi:ABC-type phosphate transport system substrate-binding protein
MKKQIKVSLTISAALVAMAGIAQAAPAELNIYGASAQYTYWNAQAQNFAQTQLGCTASAPVNNGGKHGFVSATGCTSTLVPQNAANGNSRDLDIRYSGIASAEGPLAASKQAPLDATLLTSTAGPCSQALGERAMYASSSTTVCKVVHVGTSDVAGESLIQTSSGQKLGPLGGGAVSYAMSGVNTTGLTPNNTVVVPFGFFVNNSVIARTCTSGLIGNYCTADTQCDTAPANATGVCNPTGTTITNISREEASLLFSGVIKNWTDLGAYFTSATPAVHVCLRHAGSGTHSALDLTVMNSGWGANTVIAEKNVTTGPAALRSPPFIWFNASSGDEIKCVNGASTANPNGLNTVGAIGYADADQALGAANTSQNVAQLKYNGFYPTRTAIRNGLYDFYTNAWLYTNADATVANTIVNDPTVGLIVYAQNPANVPASKANYWAAGAEMKYNRAADTGYPAKAKATSIQTP